MSLYSRGRTRRSLIDTVAFRAVSQIATILGYIVMVRGMSKHDFGTFNLLYSFIPVLSTVASLGLEQTLRRYQPEYLREGNQAAAAWLVRVVASARFGTNVILLAALLFTWNYFAPFFKLDPYRVEFAFFCLLVLLFFQSRVLQLALAGRMLHRYSVGSMAVLAIVKLVAYVILASQESLTVRNAILAETLGFGIAYLSMLGAYRRYCLAGRGSVYSPDPEEKRRLFRYGLFNNFNDAGTLMLTTRTDNFFIAAILDPVAVGVYSFYSRLNIMGLHLLPVKLFENVIQPVFFAVSREEADRKLPQYFSLLLNLNLMLQWPMFAYATAYHAEIVQVVFGGKFVEQSWLLPLMVAFAMVNVVATPVTLVAQYEERPLILLTSKVFGIYNAVALILLLPVAGVYGAAIASGTAQAMKNGFIWWKVRQRARWTNGGAALLSGILVWGGVILVCRAFGVLFREVPIVSLGVGAFVVALGALLHVRGPAISAGDRTILSTVLRGREAKWLRRVGILHASGRRPGSGGTS